MRSDSSITSDGRSDHCGSLRVAVETVVPGWSEVAGTREFGLGKFDAIVRSIPLTPPSPGWAGTQVPFNGLFECSRYVPGGPSMYHANFPLARALQTLPWRSTVTFTLPLLSTSHPEAQCPCVVVGRWPGHETKWTTRSPGLWTVTEEDEKW